MTSKELQGLDIMPFDGGVMADVMDGCIAEQDDMAQFAVMLRYLDLFTRSIGVPIEIPLMNVCLERKGYKMNVYSGFSKLKADIMKQLFDRIMLGTGWSYSVWRKNDMIAASQEPNLSETIGIHDWKKVVSMMPEILALSKEQDIVITVCWSARIARYFEYVARHFREVESMFGDEAAIIRRILCKMADPYAVGRHLQCCQDRCYAMAHFVEGYGGAAISAEEMDYNFFIQGIVLHLFLSHAEELFGLPQYGPLR